MTSIALLGTGRMATTLARAWLDKGNSLVLGSRNPEAAPARLGALAEQVKVVGFAEACAGAEVIVMAVPFHAVGEVIGQCGDLTGKVVIDTTNPWSPGTDRLAVGPETSAAEEIARQARGAHVIKALNGIFYKALREPLANGHKLSMFYCGDDDHSKSTVAALALQLGFDPIDCGPLPRARILESIALLWARLAFEQGMGTDIAITLVRR
ncbi:MAG: NADPH-dependent F420 reductase [Myxococcales bacterium]|nr:NADPH-dependent F420 reductase [Myxococcales bacterium]